MAKSERINKKHFIIFNNNGVISASTPKDWARANQILFPNYNFVNRTPTINVIEKYLIDNLKFHKVENEEVVICYAYYSL